MRKELWDCQGANIASRNVWRNVSTSKKGILERDPHFIGVFFSQMDLGNVDMRKMQVFALNNREICDKCTDKLLCLREVYCEIYIL